MAIVAYQQRRVGLATIVSVTTDLIGVAYFHWYVDGVWVGRTLTPTRSFSLAAGRQASVEVVDTADPDFDPALAPPAAWPARRTLFWTRPAGDVRRYRVEQRVSGGGWQTIAVVHQREEWSHEVHTPVLVDLTVYDWRIVPVDSHGNDGEALELGPETVVRRPEAPRFGLSWNSGDGELTITEAA